MKKILPYIVIAILVGGFIGFRACVKKVPLGYAGVRIYLLKSGVAPEDLKPGYHLIIFGVHELKLMDMRKQIDTMVPKKGTGIRPEFQLIAKDQLEVGLDVSLVYSLTEGTAQQALHRYQAGSAFKSQIQTWAGKTLTEVMGQLTAEEFFDSVKRTAQAEIVRQTLNDLANNETPEFFTVDHVLIRNVKYDEGFEARLLKNQIFGQQKQLFEAQEKMARELEKTQMIQKQTAAKVLAIQEEKIQETQVMRAQTDAEIKRITADAEYYQDTIEAEANRYQRQKVALGDLEITMAQARGEKAINAAYSGMGGQLLLVKKMVDSISFGHIEINTNRTNPFNVWELLEMLGADPKTMEEAATASTVRDRETSNYLEELRAKVAADEAATDSARQGTGFLDSGVLGKEPIPTPE